MSCHERAQAPGGDLSTACSYKSDEYDYDGHNDDDVSRLSWMVMVVNHLIIGNELQNLERSVL